MKLSITSLAVALATANALVFDKTQFPLIQDEEVLSELKSGGKDAAATLIDHVDSVADNLVGAVDGLSSVSKEWVHKKMLSVAEQLNIDANGVSNLAVEAWYEVLKTSPKLLGPMVDAVKEEYAKTVKTAQSKLADVDFKLPKGDWLHVLSNKESAPGYVLTAKDPSSLDLDDVKQYSGYISKEEEDKHFFYWFFESRNDPKNDPVILWLNGGPGCSSLTGLFFELGPSSINEDIKPVRNPYSWNSNASVIFLDQPVNTGYSYSSSDVSDTVTAAQDVYAFLTLFFEQFPKYNKGHDFHIAGESYAGHYIPVIADEILSHEDRTFDLTSVLIGNGLTDPLRQYDLYEPMACGQGGEPSVLEPEQCEAMVDSQSRCDNLIQACYSSESVWTCVPSAIYCNNAMFGPYQETGLNVYDIRKECEPEGGNLCYTGLTYVEKYLNLPEVQKAVGAQVESYTGCNMEVNSNFLFHGDWMRPYYTSVSNILEKGLPVLVYAGDKDYICNWLGNQEWTKELEWSGHDGFYEAPAKPWLVGKTEAGKVTNYEHFTFLRVYGAGHMVPYDQPEASLDLVNRWVSGDFKFQ